MKVQMGIGEWGLGGGVLGVKVEMGTGEGAGSKGGDGDWGDRGWE